MIVTGITLTFFGSRSIDVTVYIGCVLIMISLLFFIVFELIYQNSHGAEEFIWIVGGPFIIIGIPIGYLFNKIQKIFFTFFGIYFGYIVGNLIYYFILIQLKLDQSFIYWITIGICSLSIAILSFFFYDYTVIYSTALTGSYFFARVFFIFI